MTREEAIQKIKDDLRLHHDYLSGNYRKALRIAIEALQQPEIVRCKDCKHSQGGGYPHCNRVTWWNGENDYCSRAERREG